MVSTRVPPPYVPPMVQGADAESHGFFDGARAGELRIQSCVDCGQLRHPPGPMCPSCHSRNRHWTRVSGEGRIWSFVVPHPPLLPGFLELAPYAVVTVEIDEDPTIRLVGNLVTAPGRPPNEIDPASIAIGEPVRAVFHPVEDTAFVQWARIVPTS